MQHINLHSSGDLILKGLHDSSLGSMAIDPGGNLILTFLNQVDPGTRIEFKIDTSSRFALWCVGTIAPSIIACASLCEGDNAAQWLSERLGNEPTNRMFDKGAWIYERSWVLLFETSVGDAFLVSASGEFRSLVQVFVDGAEMAWT